MKIVIGIFFLMTIGVGHSYSQNIILGPHNVLIRTKKYADIIGTAYLYPSWATGTLTEKNGNVYVNLMLKYDSYKDIVELNQDGQILEVSAVEYPKFTLTFVEPGTDKLIKHSFLSGFDIPGFSRINYFDLIYEGRLTLLKKYKTSFLEMSVANYGNSGEQKSFQLDILYFLIEQGKFPKELKLNKRSIIEAFPKKGASIESFMKEKKMKGKTEADLIEIIKFLDAN
ncbi:MAG: hypothetical protein ABL895_11620 [Cyclobacteriaceae bacterium]